MITNTRAKQPKRDASGHDDKRDQAHIDVMLNDGDTYRTMHIERRRDDHEQVARYHLRRRRGAREIMKAARG